MPLAVDSAEQDYGATFTIGSASGLRVRLTRLVACIRNRAGAAGGGRVQDYENNLYHRLGLRPPSQTEVARNFNRAGAAWWIWAYTTSENNLYDRA